MKKRLKGWCIAALATFLITGFGGFYVAWNVSITIGYAVFSFSLVALIAAYVLQYKANRSE